MGTLDLDAARAARSETSGKGHTLVLGGKKFKLPPEVPVETSFGIADRDYRGAMRALLGDEQYAEFMAQRPSTLDISELLNGLDVLYAVGSPGESQASADSSPSNGSRSRPTSRRSTASTSADSAGEPTE